MYEFLEEVGMEEGCFYFSGRCLLFRHDDISNAVYPVSKNSLFPSRDTPNRYVSWRSQTTWHIHFSHFIMWQYLHALAHKWMKCWSWMRSSSLKPITALLNPAVLYQPALLSLPLRSVYQWAVMHKYTSDWQKDAKKKKMQRAFFVPVMMASSMSKQLIRSKASCLQLETEKLFKWQSRTLVPL